MKVTHLLLVPIVLGGIAGCRSGDKTNPPPKPIDPVKAAFRKEIPQATGVQHATVANGANQFSLNLLRQVIKEQPNQNVVLYPLGLVQNLTLIHESAQGKSREIIEKLLGVKGTTGNVLASFHSAFLNDQESDINETLRMANSYWLADSLKIDSKAASRFNALFGCSVQSFPADLNLAKKMMDEWVSKNTDGAIKGIKSDLQLQTMAVILSAMVFNGRWSQEFDPSHTQPDFFKTPSGKLSTPMMNGHEVKCRNNREDPLLNIELPFLGDRFVFIGIVPENPQLFKATLAKLDSKAFAKFTKGMVADKLTVQMPRLNLASELSLETALKAIGGKELFTPCMDALNLAPLSDGLILGQVKNQALLTLDEKGVKVKAVVETTMVGSAAESIRFDRPFLYFIVHKPSGTIVVCGVVNDPTKN